MIINELWLEVNVVRKFGVFLGQCFADKLSKIPFAMKDNATATFMRQILEIDIMQALTLVRLSEERITNLQELVTYYVKWLQYKEEGPDGK